MTDFPPQIIGPIWGASEFALALWKRSRANATSHDRGSLTLIWVVHLIVIGLAIVAAYHLSHCRLPWRIPASLDYGLMAAGLALRWYAIIYLGRFFTTNVAIASDHRVVNTGPYRFVRHPSYTGSLLALLSLALGFQNWASLIIIIVPCFAVFLWRIHIEEAALISGLGEPYRQYMQHTKRLLPFIY